MQVWSKFVRAFAALALAASAAPVFATPAAQDAGSTIVIVLKNGKQQSFNLSDVARIEFSTPASAAMGWGRGRFIGDWKVGDGAGGTFTITLKPDGKARKSMGSGSGGTWTVVDGEAQITWDDGWHDVIRRVNGKFQKAAYSPGASLDDQPSNVAEAEKRAEPN